MKGLLHVITGRRAAPTEAEPTPSPPATPPASPGASAEAAGQMTALPAGVDAGPEVRVTFASRGRLRRRLRYLRRVRELGLRDVGGLVFEQHRHGQERPELVATKLAALSTVDGELRALERALDARREATELREPGICACPRCGALHASDARFCSSCGLSLRGARPIAGIGEGLGARVGEIGSLGLFSQTAPASAAPPPQPTQAMPRVEPEPNGATDGADDGSGTASASERREP